VARQRRLDVVREPVERQSLEIHRADAPRYLFRVFIE
jgi:hypothetical protein